MREKFHILSSLFVRTALLLVSLVVLLAACATAALWQLGRIEMLPVALSTVGVAGLGALAGLLPMTFCRDSAKLASMWMVGTTLRLLVTGSAGAALIGLTDFNGRSVAVWLVAWYMLLLAFETVVAVRTLRGADHAGGTGVTRGAGPAVLTAEGRR